MNKKLENAIETINEQCIPIQAAADLMNISQMYFRRLIQDGSPVMQGLEKVDVFGRILYTKDSVQAATEMRSQVVEAKQAAKEAKEARQGEGSQGITNKGPTLMDLRLTARSLGVPYSNKNKAELITDIEAVKPGESGADLDNLSDALPANSASDAIDPTVLPPEPQGPEDLSLDSILAE